MPPVRSISPNSAHRICVPGLPLPALLLSMLLLPAIGAQGQSGAAKLQAPRSARPALAINATDYVIPAGKTVSFTGSVVIVANTVNIAGRLVAGGAKGQSVTIQSKGDVVISGAVLAGDGAFVPGIGPVVEPRSGATLVGLDGGSVTITSATGKIGISGPVMAGDGATPPLAVGSDGSALPANGSGKGTNGGSVLLHAPKGSITVAAAAGLIHIGNGGRGADVQIGGRELLKFTGNPGNGGGSSGVIWLDSPTIAGVATLRLTLPTNAPPRHPVFAAGTTILVPTSNNVSGGTGGNAGNYRYGADASGRSIWPSDSSALRAALGINPDIDFPIHSVTGDNGEWGFFHGGTGGDATVVGINGTYPGGNGQTVEAHGGGGGDSPIRTGYGGNAAAAGGNGAAGSNSPGKGGNGGSATATGGLGNVTVVRNAARAFTIATAKGGNGGVGGSNCMAATGGAGGSGGSASATGDQATAIGGNGNNGGLGYSAGGPGGSGGAATAIGDDPDSQLTQSNGADGNKGSVCQDKLISVKVTPAAITVQVGQLVNYTATATFKSGRKQDATKDSIWTTGSKGAIVAIDAAATATAVAPGTDTVSAAFADPYNPKSVIVGAATITVSAPSHAGLWLGGGMESTSLCSSVGAILFAGNNTWGQGGSTIPRQDNQSKMAAGPKLAGVPSQFNGGPYSNAAVVPSSPGKLRQGPRSMVAAPVAGQLYTWGSNYYGNLGDGTMNDNPTPIAVPGMDSVIYAFAGNGKTIAVKSDGTVWDWGGYSGFPALGDGTTNASSTPVQVTGLTGIIAVTSATYWGFHSLALKSDGTVWAWGPNSAGQIGDGTTTDRPTAVQVKGLTNVIAITASQWG